MNYFGLFSGLATLLIIGMGFPLVILGERYLGRLWWPYMLTAGLVLMAASLAIIADWLSVLVAVLGATLAWGSTELRDQAARARLGWHPNRPRKLVPPFADIIKTWREPHL